MVLPLEDKELLYWNEQKKKSKFNRSTTLTFRYLIHNKHLNSYQGVELQFVGFDELTQFPGKPVQLSPFQTQKT